MTAPRVGVLALQGGVAEHVRSLRAAGAEPVLLRRPAQLDAVDAVVLPGGESSTIDRLLRQFGLADPLRERLSGGLPALATCAGLVVLAAVVEDPAPGQQTLHLLPVSVRRNAFGRQVASEVTVVATTDGPVRAAFIRAPVVTGVDGDVEVFARHRGEIVGVRTATITAVAFHPELTGDLTLHAELVRRAGALAPR